MMDNKTTLVFGASLNPARYSYRAIHMLREVGIPVYGIGGREGNVLDIQVEKGHPELQDIDTITLYMGERNIEEHEDYLLSLRPSRIIFNPGAENPRLASKAKELGIDSIEACTLVMLRTGQY